MSIKCLSPPFLSPETFRKLRRIHLRNAYNTVMNERGLPEATHAEEADANRAYDPQIERRYGEPDPKTLKAAEAAAMAAEASLNEDDMGYVSPAPPATSPPPILDKGQMAFWGGHYADYREETPHAPDGSPMTRNTAKGIAPYLISGNKGDLVGLHGAFYLRLAQDANGVFDAFGGAAIYTHFLASQEPLSAGSVWNEWEYSCAVTNRQIRDNPAAVVREVIAMRNAYREAFPLNSLPHDYESMLKTRQGILDWINQQTEQIITARTLDEMGRLPIPDTPQAAALYLFLQSHMTEGRVTDFDLNDKGLPRPHTSGKENGKDDFKFISASNDEAEAEDEEGDGTLPDEAAAPADMADKVIAWEQPWRIWSDKLPNLIRDASQRLKQTTVRHGDGWQLAAEAPNDSLVFVDTSYFASDEQVAARKKVMNYGRSTLGDGNPLQWFEKFRRYLLPKSNDVRYVITNNFNSQVVEMLEQVGWSVLQTYRGSPKKPKYEFIALSPAAAAAINLPKPRARTLAPGGLPRAGFVPSLAGATPETGRGLSTGESKQAGKRDPQSGPATPVLDATMAGGPNWDFTEKAKVAAELDADRRAGNDPLDDSIEVEDLDREAQMQEDADRFLPEDDNDVNDVNNVLPASPRIHPATGQPLAAANRKPTGPTYPGLKKPTLPKPAPRPELFGEWSASLSNNDLIGYRGVITPGKDNGFGNTEGNGIYLMRKQQEAAVFGKVQRISFPEPTTPFLVDDGNLHLLHESEDLDQPIDTAKDSPWLQASKYAAQHAHNLGKGKWDQELAGDILTKLLMEAGYDSVYVKGAPEDWIVLLRETRPGQKPLEPLFASTRLPSTPWPDNFPDVVIHTNIATMRKHPLYTQAKAGDARAAINLVVDIVKPDRVRALSAQFPQAMWVAVHAEEATGRNKIPLALSRYAAELGGQDFDANIVQTNRVNHTGADAAGRLGRTPQFTGRVEIGREYIVVDDVTTSGSSLAGLRDYIVTHGGKVVAAMTLATTSNPQTGYGGHLALKPDTAAQLRRFDKTALETILRDHGIADNANALTNSQGRYIATFQRLDTLRNRLAAAGQTGISGPNGDAITPADKQADVSEVNEQLSLFSASRLEESAIQGYLDLPNVNVPASKQPTAKRAIRAATASTDPYELPASGGSVGNAGRLDALRERAQRTWRGLMNQDVDALKEAFRESDSFSSLLHDFISRGIPRFDIRGAIIESAADFAAFNLAVRTPYFESLKIAILDAANQVVHSQIVHVGGLNEAIADPKVIAGIIATARMLNPKSKLTGWIIAHNHPSGDPRPSDADRRVTRRLLAMGENIGLPLIDHVVTNGERYFSFRESGMIFSSIDDSIDQRPTRSSKPKLPVLPTPTAPFQDNVADYEALPSGSLKTSIFLNAPDKTLPYLQTLRTADPDHYHVLYLDTRLALRAVERIPTSVTLPQLFQRIVLGSAREGGYAFTLGFPATLETTNVVQEDQSNAAAPTPQQRQIVRRLREQSQSIGLVFADAMTHSQERHFSFSEYGLMEEPGALASAPRRARESMNFDPPFKAPFGDILSYSWASKPIGGMQSQRVSDWNNAITNGQTGRAIVHLFKVRKPDGIHTVSLETALGLLSSQDRNRLTSIIRSKQKEMEDEATGQMALFASERLPLERALQPTTGTSALFRPNPPRLPVSESPSLLQRAFTAAQRGQSSQWLPIRRVWDAFNAQNPVITPAAFMRSVKAADDAGTVYLSPPESAATVEAAGPFKLRNASGIMSTDMTLAAADRQLQQIADNREDLRAQAAWLAQHARIMGLANPDELPLSAPAAFERLARRWRATHPKSKGGNFVQNAAIRAIVSKLYGKPDLSENSLDDRAGTARTHLQSAATDASQSADAKGHLEGDGSAAARLAADQDKYKRTSANAWKRWLKEFAEPRGILLTKLPRWIESKIHTDDDLGQSEHHVFDMGHRVLKVTKGTGSSFGLWPKPTPDGKDPWTLDYIASPWRYLQKLHDSNLMFGDDIVLHAVVVDKAWNTNLIISQPKYDLTPATTDQVQDAMKASGFHVSKSLPSAFYRPADNTAVLDFHLENGGLTPGDNPLLLPFDVTVFHPTGALREAIARDSDVAPGEENTTK